MRRGFTLIELLAVIVILAIIALITIPAILKMVDNAKVSSYRRSIDLYGRAINSAIAAYKSDKIEKKEPYQVTFKNVSSYIDYEGNDIDCKISKIYSDDTIILTECNVGGNQVYAEKNKGYGKENYYYYTNANKRIRTIEYINAINDALREKQNIGNTCQVQENGNLLCNGITIEVTSNLEKPISGTITIQNNEVTSYSQLKFKDKKIETQEEIPTVIDEGSISTGDNQNNNNGNNNNQNNNTNQSSIISTTDSYIGYYADVDGNGTVDGVIYADLAFSKSGQWYGNANANDDTSRNYGKFTYTKQTNLKEYIINENKYEGYFGKKEVLKLKPNSTGNPRFYVMSLEDFNIGSFGEDNVLPGTYYWYKNANCKMNSVISESFGTGYDNTGKIIEIWNKNGVGEGSYSGATQDDHDIWKHIQGEYKKGWYVPSNGEWVAFVNNLGINANNFMKNYKLSVAYWSSSKSSSCGVWYAYFVDGLMREHSPFYPWYVRLGITF